MRSMLIVSILISQLYSFDIDVQSLKMEAENDSENINVRMILAKQYIKNKNYSDAQTVLNEILKVDNNNQKANILLNKINKQSTNHVSAVTPSIFQRAKRLEKIYKKTHSFEDFKEYFYELEGLGEKELGFKKLEKFVKNNKTDESAVLFLANRYYWSGLASDSLKVLKPVINRTSNIDLLSLYANLLLENGFSYKALKEFKKVVSLGGENEDIRKKIQELQKNQLTQKSENKKVAKKKRTNHKHIAEKLYFKNRYKKAIRHYKLHFKKHSGDNLTRFHYASSLEKLKQYKNAQRQYKRVSDEYDKLHNLSTYRYAKVLMAQKVDYKWDEARDVLESLLYTLSDQNPSKERDALLKYTEQSLQIASNPIPKAKQFQDVMLTAEQDKMLGEDVFAATSIQTSDTSSIKSMLNPSLSTLKNSEEVDGTFFISNISDNNIKSNSFGVKVTKSGFSIEAKKSTFKNDESNKSKKQDANSIKLSYTNGDNISATIGIDSFKDDTYYTAGAEYQTSYKNHNLSYGINYQNGIFVNPNTCMVENDINVLTLSLYDSMLLENMKELETSLILNNFSDDNLNLNAWVKYPIYRSINGTLENKFSYVGNYEYNSKEDTCYGSADFFDNSQIEIKSKYKLPSNGYIEAHGSVGYSLKNAKLLYSYGALLDIVTSNSINIFIDCRHYQSGYSPDGANECYASFSKVW